MYNYFIALFILILLVCCRRRHFYAKGPMLAIIYPVSKHQVPSIVESFSKYLLNDYVYFSSFLYFSMLLVEMEWGVLFFKFCLILLEDMLLLFNSRSGIKKEGLLTLYICLKWSFQHIMQLCVCACVHVYSI